MVSRLRIGERFASLLVLALLVCAAPLVAQQYLDAFANGIRAIDQQRWADAARQMQIAANMRADTGDNTRVYGTRFEVYAPNYFLGVALYESGNFEGALEAFTKAETLGGVKRNNNYYTRLQRLRGDAQERVRLARGPVTPTPRPATPAPTPAPPTRAADTTPPPVAEAPALAPPAPAPAVRAPAPAVTPTVPPEVTAAEQAVQRAIATRDTVSRIPDLDTLRQFDGALARTDATARANLAEASAKLESGRRGNGADLDRAGALSRQATSEFQQVGQLAAATLRKITTEMVAATTPYFDGKYAAARTALNQLSYPGGKFAGQWRLFLSATDYALFVLGGQRDEAMRREAEAHARECRRILGAGFKPDPRAFSPRFIEFFTAVR